MNKPQQIKEKKTNHNKISSTISTLLTTTQQSFQASPADPPPFVPPSPPPANQQQSQQLSLPSQQTSPILAFAAKENSSTTNQSVRRSLYQNHNNQSKKRSSLSSVHQATPTHTTSIRQSPKHNRQRTNHQGSDQQRKSIRLSEDSRPKPVYANQEYLNKDDELKDIHAFDSKDLKNVIMEGHRVDKAEIFMNDYTFTCSRVPSNYTKDKCVICQTPFNDSATIYQTLSKLPCSHIFHRNCLQSVGI
jgi:hypothetical protein